MKKIIWMTYATFFLSLMANAQSQAYKNLINFAKEQGWTFYSDKLIYLKQGESGNGYFSLPGNREYRIFCVAEYSEVTDVDSWVYDDAGTLMGKNIDDGRMAIVRIDMPAQSDVKVTIKNIKATRPYDEFECRILVTYRTKAFSSSVSSNQSSSSSLSASELYKKGDDYYFGRGVTKDYAEAIKWFRLAADKGHDNAMHDVGYMYSNSQGVTKDYAAAMRWYLKAAEKGNVKAMNAIGFMYDQAQGVERDYWEALKWYHKSADNGHATAMYNIGMLYKNGKGVAQNIDEAKRWFKKSADKGFDKAIAILKEF